MEKQLRDEAREVILGGSDHARLTSLVALDRLPHAAERLLTEPDRARIVADDAVPTDVVRMGSTVEFRSEDDCKRVTLVFPAEADIETGEASVLTPIGAAPIGLAKGETGSARDGRRHELTILAVEQPAP